MNEFVAIIILAVVVERLISFIREVASSERSINAIVIMLISFAIGIALAYEYNLSGVAALGIAGNSGVFDKIITGIAIGGGSNLIFDIVSLAKEAKDKMEVAIEEFPREK